MIRVIIVDQAGKTISAPDLTTAAELREAVEQAKQLIRECERIAQQHAPPGRQQGTGVIPYLT